MGIDIYARWESQTRKEQEAQRQALCSPKAGNVGYLWEDSDGGILPSGHLLREAFHNLEGAFIPAKTLRERLPMTLRLASLREQSCGDTTKEELKAVLKSYMNFVELCERQEAKTRQPVKIIVSW
jgi:hypothetical protein